MSYITTTVLDCDPLDHEQKVDLGQALHGESIYYHAADRYADGLPVIHLHHNDYDTAVEQGILLLDYLEEEGIEVLSTFIDLVN